jgi:hypothetical protein
MYEKRGLISYIALLHNTSQILISLKQIAEALTGGSPHKD